MLPLALDTGGNNTVAFLDGVDKKYALWEQDTTAVSDGEDSKGRG